MPSPRHESQQLAPAAGFSAGMPPFAVPLFMKASDLPNLALRGSNGKRLNMGHFLQRVERCQELSEDSASTFRQSVIRTPLWDRLTYQAERQSLTPDRILLLFGIRNGAPRRFVNYAQVRDRSNKG